MSKSSRKKKEKEKDFKKVKLKVGKKLKKTRDTSSEFKARKLVLQSQMGVTASNAATVDAQAASTAKSTPKDCYPLLKHHNKQQRKDALGLLGRLLADDGVLFGGLAALVPALSPLLYDAEKELRVPALELLAAVVGRAGEGRLGPQSGLLFAHLACGLTHVNGAVKFNCVRAALVLMAGLPKASAQSTELLEGLMGLLKGLGGSSAVAAGRLLSQERKLLLLHALEQYLGVLCPTAAAQGEEEDGKGAQVDGQVFGPDFQTRLTKADIVSPFYFPVIGQFQGSGLGSVAERTESARELIRGSAPFLASLLGEFGSSESGLESAERVTASRRIVTSVASLLRATQSRVAENRELEKELRAALSKKAFLGPLHKLAKDTRNKDLHVPPDLKKRAKELLQSLDTLGCPTL